MDVESIVYDRIVCVLNTRTYILIYNLFFIIKKLLNSRHLHALLFLTLLKRF